MEVSPKGISWLGSRKPRQVGERGRHQVFLPRGALKFLCRHRLAWFRTSGFQPDGTGSNPVGGTRALSSEEERFPYKEEVVGSSPTAPTT